MLFSTDLSETVAPRMCVCGGGEGGGGGMRGVYTYIYIDNFKFTMKKTNARLDKNVA